MELSFEQWVTLLGSAAVFFSLVVVPIVVALINNRKAKENAIKQPIVDIGTQIDIVHAQNTSGLLKMIVRLEEENAMLLKESNELKVRLEQDDSK